MICWKLPVWLNENLPLEFAKSGYMILDDWNAKARIFREILRKLFAAGYTGVHWPTEYGGQGGTLMQHIIVTEELSASLSLH
jgi:alkylation response protein AidB-like acyl-CoA dehydrogenase